MDDAPRVPVELLPLLAGRSPAIGLPSQMFPLLTVDDLGYPHACFVSCAEVRAAEDSIVVTIASRASRGNLERSGRALLLAVVDDAAYHLKLRVRRAHREDDRVTVTCTVTHVKRDSVGVALRAMTFVPTDELRELERWTASQRALGHFD